ncbi:MAG: (2E,6E)-farnesyl diphosphate synthase [bacterium]
MSNDSPLKQFQQQSARRVEAALDRWMPATSIQPLHLHEAMRYATISNGKYVRPMLVYATGEALGIKPEILDASACAVELIHAFSLVHDDLPSMDDDDLRRGRPTCHNAYDEATAILAGDAMQSLAFSILGKHLDEGIDAQNRVEMMTLLADASGSRGMAGGQALDIAATGSDLTLPALENMHIHKTGALIRACVQLAALSANAPTEQQKDLDHYAKAVGLAFQVQDDILDVTGDTSSLGKTSGKDEADNKPTYPSLLGLQGARDTAQQLKNAALESLQTFDEKADILRNIAHYVVERSR